MATKLYIIEFVASRIHMHAANLPIISTQTAYFTLFSKLYSVFSTTEFLFNLSMCAAKHKISSTSYAKLKSCEKKMRTENHHRDER